MFMNTSFNIKINTVNIVRIQSFQISKNQFNCIFGESVLIMSNDHIMSALQPVLGEWQSSYRRCRRDEVVLCRARIGHTHLTHSYILKKDPPPVCERCQCNLTVRHILVECNHFAQERKYIFGRRDVVESFRFQPTLIVLFLKQIEFYYKFKKS